MPTLSHLFRLIPSFIALTLVTCVRSPDAIVGPLRVPDPAFNIQPDASDGCDYDSFSSCHANGVSYNDGSGYWFCPTGCHTYPLSPIMRSRMNNALTRIDRTLCGWAYSYLQRMLAQGSIRTYDQYDYAYADFHFSIPTTASGPDYSGYMHVWTGGTTDNRELADTLVHEAYHGYFNSEDEVTAASTAATCTF